MGKFQIKPENTDSISISVFDEDFGKDDTLGSATLDLHSVQEYKTLKNRWIPLQNCKSGEVLVSAEFLTLSDIPKESQPMQKKIDAPEQIVEESKAQKIPEVKGQEINVPSNEKTIVSSEKKPLDRGQIYITIFKAKDIEKKGMFGKADPYVTLSMGKQKAKSATVKNSHNPEWNYKASFDVDETTPHEINISVFDEDVGKDDSLGNAVLDISSIQEKSQLINQWIPLSNCKSGKILVSAEFVPQGKIVDYLRSQSESEVKESIPVEVKEASDIEPKEISSEPEKVITKDEIEVQQTESESTVNSELETPVAKPLTAGQVKITVFKAKGIEKKGMFGKADPYVKLTLDNQKAKSATVKNNHNPEWNFEAIFNISDKTSQNLNLAVFDDDIGKDDSLGSAVIDLRKLQEQQHLLNQWITLDKCKYGEVLVSAEFIPMSYVEKPAVSPEPQVINKDEKAPTVEKTNIEIVSHEKRIDIASEVVVDDKKEKGKGAKGLKDTLSKEKESLEGDKKVDTVLMKKNILQLKPLEAGDISITVHKARDIEKKGMMGKADPYVVLLYGDQQAKSKTIKNNHNPEWEYTAKFQIKPENTDSIS